MNTSVNTPKVISIKYISLFLIILFAIFYLISPENTYAEFVSKPPPPMKLSDPLPGNLFVELARIINPAVVNISTSSVVRGQRFRDPLMDLFEQFYGVRPQQTPNKPQKMALGTGFIIREDGLILTNNHVIQGADIIQVQLTEKSEKLYTAKLIGYDSRIDVGLIKIDAGQKLSVASLGSSKDVEVGEWVAAFGNPFGHGHSMSKGIISSKGRDIEEINKIPLLQTDASINPGNSGGPLVNSKGYVIGVNQAIDARAQGIGFAIPIDEVKKVLPELESRGSIRKGYIGVSLGDLDPQAAESIGLEEGTSAAVIVGVERGGPAAKAGFKPYDVVLEFNGKKIRHSTDLSDAVADSNIGEKSKVLVMRDGKKMSLTVKSAERPDEKTFSQKLKNLGNFIKPDKNKKESGSSSTTHSEEIKAPSNLGFYLADLDDRLKNEWDISDAIKKPMIVRVEQGTIAQLAGLRVGDLVLAVNDSEVSTAKEALSKLGKSSNTFKIGRGHRVIVISISE